MAVVFNSLRPMLRTKALNATIEFYTRRLGFVCEGFSAEDGWASLRLDAVEIMVATPNVHVPFDAPVFTGSF
jgi:catechol 2,3-dioxygenase-like lactoylglutathione lyase family enzyme